MSITSLQISRSILVLAIGLTLSACGARSTNEYGLEEATGIMLVGERLTGLRVEVGDWYSETIDSDDVSRRLSTWTARENREEKMQRVLIESRPGQQSLKVYSNDGLVIAKDLYLSAGQKLEVRVPVSE